MSLRKNLTVVPSDTPEPNQVKERVSLFNQDGTPFSAGGGPRVVFRAMQDSSTQVPHTLEGPASNTVSMYPDYSLAWDGGVPFMAEDLTWYAPGDAHGSWGVIDKGHVAFEALPGKLYKTHVYLNPSIFGDNTILSGQGATLSVLVQQYTYPKSSDEWSGNTNGSYNAFGVELSDQWQGGGYIEGPFSTNDWLAAVSKVNGNSQRTMVFDSSFLNDYPVPCTISTGIIAKIGTQIDPTTIKLSSIDFFITEESVS